MITFRSQCPPRPQLHSTPSNSWPRLGTHALCETPTLNNTLLLAPHKQYQEKPCARYHPLDSTDHHTSIPWLPCVMLPVPAYCRHFRKARNPGNASHYCVPNNVFVYRVQLSCLHTHSNRGAVVPITHHTKTCHFLLYTMSMQPMTCIYRGNSTGPAFTFLHTKVLLIVTAKQNLPMTAQHSVLTLLKKRFIWGITHSTTLQKTKYLACTASLKTLV